MIRIALIILAVCCINLHTSAQLFVTKTNNRWTTGEEKFILSKDTATMLPVRKLHIPQDSVILRSKSFDVIPDSTDLVLKTLVYRMYKAMRDTAAPGVGIAAPQVGINRNIIWVKRYDKENEPFHVYLNPKIRQYSRLKRAAIEGCLSIPNRRETVVRSYAILIEYDTMDGKHYIEMVEDYTARIFQHEIDHLNGVLYIDRLEPEIDKETKTDE